MFYIVVDQASCIKQGLEMMWAASDHKAISLGATVSTHRGHEQIAILQLAVSCPATSARQDLSGLGTAAVGHRATTVLLLHNARMGGKLQPEVLNLLSNPDVAFASFDWKAGGTHSLQHLLKQQFVTQGFAGFDILRLRHFHVLEKTGTDMWGWRGALLYPEYDRPCPSSGSPAWKVSGLFVVW